MREIEFRGRRTDNGEWVHGYYVVATGGQLGIGGLSEVAARICHVIIVDGEFFHVDPETVGQYTGLKDKNGKEVYEGDIVSADELICEVKWGRNTHGWVAEWSENTKGRSGLGKRQPDLGFRAHEVIGNIHEHGHLLTDSGD